MSNIQYFYMHWYIHIGGCKYIQVNKHANKRRGKSFTGASPRARKECLVQWNPSKTDTIGTNDFVRCSEVSLAQGLVVDHAPPTITARRKRLY